MGYVQTGKDEGATVHFGGERIGTEGYFMQPTIFTNVTADMRIAREEIFGPVGVVIKFDDDEDIIKLANDSMYGLAAAVFSQNLSRALDTAHRLQAGTVWVGVRLLSECTGLVDMSVIGQLRKYAPCSGSIWRIQAVRYWP